MARVSVIVPTYNRVGYLEEAISSVLTQDYRDVELVVADNASTDGTAAMLADVTDTRLRHVRRDHNLGWRANFNQALHDTDSEFVALVSDDDRLLPGALGRAVSAMDAMPTAGFVHTAYHVIDEHGDLVRADGNRSRWKREDRAQPGSDFISTSMGAPSQVFLSSALMRTEALPDVCFAAADEERGDVVLFLRVALDWDVAFLTTPGAESRIHPGQLSNALDAVDTLTTIRDAKLRFLSSNASRLEHVGALRRDARGYTATAMSIPVSVAARESRTEAFRALRRAFRVRPQLVLEPTIWRTTVKVVAGPSVLGSLRGVRARRGVQHR